MDCVQAHCIAHDFQILVLVLVNGMLPNPMQLLLLLFSDF